MSKSINQVILLGHVGSVDVKTLENAIKVATFSVATSIGGYKKPDGTEVPEKTQWHNVVAWRHLAEVVEKYVKKGDKILVQGSINYRKYEDKDGQTRSVTDIMATDVSLLGSKSDSKSDVQPTFKSEYFPPIQPKDDLPF